MLCARLQCRRSLLQPAPRLVCGASALCSSCHASRAAWMHLVLCCVVLPLTFLDRLDRLYLTTENHSVLSILYYAMLCYTILYYTILSCPILYYTYLIFLLMNVSLATPKCMTQSLRGRREERHTPENRVFYKSATENLEGSCPLHFPVATAQKRKRNLEDLPSIAHNFSGTPA